MGRSSQHATYHKRTVSWCPAKLQCSGVRLSCFACCELSDVFPAPGLLTPSSPFSPPRSPASSPSFMVSVVFERGEEVEGADISMEDHQGAVLCSLDLWSKGRARLSKLPEKTWVPTSSLLHSLKLVEGS